MDRYRVANLGQGATCPAVPEVDGLNCQRTPEGGVICSDGSYFAPGCRDVPPVTTGGVATYDRSGGLVRLATPPPFNLGQETGTDFPWALVGVSVAGLVIALVW